MLIFEASKTGTTEDTSAKAWALLTGFEGTDLKPRPWDWELVGNFAVSGVFALFQYKYVFYHNVNGPGLPF